MLGYFSEELASNHSQAVANHVEQIELTKGDMREGRDALSVELAPASTEPSGSLNSTSFHSPGGYPVRAAPLRVIGRAATAPESALRAEPSEPRGRPAHCSCPIR
jgi:hypothetical protein